jgi:hypothetical protein
MMAADEWAGGDGGGVDDAGVVVDRAGKREETADGDEGRRSDGARWRLANATAYALLMTARKNDDGVEAESAGKMATYVVLGGGNVRRRGGSRRDYDGGGGD